MTEICSVSLATGRVLSIPGQRWTADPPPSVARLRRDVLAQMLAVDQLLRELALQARRLPPPELPGDCVCRLGDTAYA
ncbi:hypothetical protein [Rubrivivax sp. JA1026]|uniref:hypothetical protein n=1 Tax=Rubrivivax sp. JA1026 TaxID=2710888 RepID=UPI0013E9868A|nr:hypothetical protein [Rubrivivax sp. JA1026]